MERIGAPAETEAGDSPPRHAAHRVDVPRAKNIWRWFRRRDPGARHQLFGGCLWCAGCWWMPAVSTYIDLHTHHIRFPVHTGPPKPTITPIWNANMATPPPCSADTSHPVDRRVSVFWRPLTPALPGAVSWWACCSFAKFPACAAEPRGSGPRHAAADNWEKKKRIDDWRRDCGQLLMAGLDVCRGRQGLGLS